MSGSSVLTTKGGSHMRKIFLGVWILGFLLFVVGVAGLIGNTPWHTVLLVVGLLLWTPGFILFNFFRPSRPRN